MLWGGIDIAVFFGSAYVMDDVMFVNLFKRLKEIGVKQIIDFHGGYMNLHSIINYFLCPLRESPVIRKIFRKPSLQKEYIGKFHGYSRIRGELRRLYKKAGLELVQEIYMGRGYNYIAICDCKNDTRI